MKPSDGLSQGKFGKFELCDLFNFEISMVDFRKSARKLATSSDPTLYQGYAGIIYSELFKYLQSFEREAWYKSLAANTKNLNPELIAGNAGVLLALLKSSPVKANAAEAFILSSILQQLRTDKNGTYWLSHYRTRLFHAETIFHEIRELKMPVRSMLKIVDLGFAHGISGTVFVLSQYVLLRPKTKVYVNRYISGLCKYLLSMYKRSPHGRLETYSFDGQPGSFFYRVPRQQAWCYGTPGMSLALLWASKALNDPALKSQALKIFKDWNETLINSPPNNPYFCHGSAGLADICRFFFNQTDDIFSYLCWIYWVDLTKQLKEEAMRAGTFKASFLLEGGIGIRAVEACLAREIPDHSWSVFLGTSEIQKSKPQTRR